MFDDRTGDEWGGYNKRQRAYSLQGIDLTRSWTWYIVFVYL